ncbi:MAG: hypothetical protein U9N57_00865 [Pseudomonadota bacterium]|nr:hypothetical protein [Pseudomonadota bacterium]
MLPPHSPLIVSEIDCVLAVVDVEAVDEDAGEEMVVVELVFEYDV